MPQPNRFKPKDTRETHRAIFFPNQDRPLWVPNAMPEDKVQEVVNKHLETIQAAAREKAGFAGEVPKDLPSAVPDIIRYGVPAAVAVATKSPGRIGATAGISELAARELEQFMSGEHPSTFSEYIDKRRDNLLSSAIQGAAAFAGEKWLSPIIGVALKQMKRAGAAGVRKLTIPKGLRPGAEPLDPLDIGDAQARLGQLGAERISQVSRKQPFSLTWDQLNYERRNLITFLGSTARSAIFGAGPMVKADLRNTRAVENLVKDYITLISKTTDRITFGKTLGSLLKGEMDFVRAHRRALYDTAREAIEGKGLTTNLETLKTFFKREIGREEVQATRASIKDLLPKLKENWSDIPVENALEAVRRINRRYGRNIPEGEIGVINHIRPMLNDPVDNSLRLNAPEAREAFKIAKQYYGLTKDRLEADVIRNVRSEIKKYPRSAVSMLSSGAESGRFLDNLDAVKAAFHQSGAEREVSYKGTSIAAREFENSILQPLRYSVLLSARNKETNRIVGSAFAETLDKLGDDGIKEIFGYEGKILRDLATTLKVIDRAPDASKIFIQLVQGGQLVSLFGGAAAKGYGETTGDPFYKRVGTAGLLIFASPYALSLGLRNPRFVRALTDGIAKGPKSTAFARLTTVLSTQFTGSRIDMRKLPAEAVDFYTDMEGNSLEELTKDETKDIMLEGGGP